MNIMLNPDKCEFSKSQLKIFGHIINKEGVRADPAKTQAILLTFYDHWADFAKMIHPLLEAVILQRAEKKPPWIYL